MNDLKEKVIDHDIEEKKKKRAIARKKRIRKRKMQKLRALAIRAILKLIPAIIMILIIALTVIIVLNMKMSNNGVFNYLKVLEAVIPAGILLVIDICLANKLYTWMKKNGVW